MAHVRPIMMLAKRSVDIAKQYEEPIWSENRLREARDPWTIGQSLERFFFPYFGIQPLVPGYFSWNAWPTFALLAAADFAIAPAVAGRLAHRQSTPWLSRSLRVVLAAVDAWNLYDFWQAFREQNYEFDDQAPSPEADEVFMPLMRRFWLRNALGGIAQRCLGEGNALQSLGLIPWFVTLRHEHSGMAAVLAFFRSATSLVSSLLSSLFGSRVASPVESTMTLLSNAMHHQAFLRGMYYPRFFYASQSLHPRMFALFGGRWLVQKDIISLETSSQLLMILDVQEYVGDLTTFAFALDQAEAQPSALETTLQQALNPATQPNNTPDVWAPVNASDVAATDGSASAEVQDQKVNAPLDPKHMERVQYVRSAYGLSQHESVSLVALFDRADRDKSGAINAAELKALIHEVNQEDHQDSKEEQESAVSTSAPLLQRAQSQEERAEAARILEEADNDKSGDIDFHEFVEAVTQARSGQKKSAFGDLLSRWSSASSLFETVPAAIPLLTRALSGGAPIAAGVGTLCVICKQNERDVLLEPCAHVCVCQPCAGKVDAEKSATIKRCPVCKEEVEAASVVYIG